MLLDEDREAELRELVERLDRLVPKDGAHVTMPADEGPDTTLGNRLGYLRLGIELLAAALRPLPATEDAPARIAPDLGYLLTAGSRAPLEQCELDESIGSRPPARTRFGALGQLAVAVALVLLLVALFVGAAVLWRWTFG